MTVDDNQHSLYKQVHVTLSENFDCVPLKYELLRSDEQPSLVLRWQNDAIMKPTIYCCTIYRKITTQLA